MCVLRMRTLTKGQKQEMQEMWKEGRLRSRSSRKPPALSPVAHHATCSSFHGSSVENGELRTESPVWLLAPVAASGSAAATAPQGLVAFITLSPPGGGGD